MKVVNNMNHEMSPEVRTLDMNLGQIEKGGYPHFMLKEIFEQPECLENCMRGRVNVDANKVMLSAVIDYKKQLLNAKRIQFIVAKSLMAEDGQKRFMVQEMSIDRLRKTITC